MKPEQAMDTLVGIGFSYAAHINGSCKGLKTEQAKKLLAFATKLNEASTTMMKYRVDNFGRIDTEYLKNSVIDKMGGI